MPPSWPEPIAAAPFDRMHAFDEEPVIVSSPRHPPIGRKDSAPRSVLVFENGCPHRKRLEDWYAKRGEMPERTIELGSYHAMLGCVVAGMGIALLPESVLSTFPEGKRLTVHRLPTRRESRRDGADLAQGRGFAERPGNAKGAAGRTNDPRPCS